MTTWKGDRSLEVLTLGLEGEIFAIEAGCVREILDLVPITDVPGADPFLNGLINVRGKVVPLADLRPRFGMEQKPSTIDTRIIVIEVAIDSTPVIVGLRADKVYEIAEISAASLEETPRIGMRWRPEYVLCIGKRGADFVVVIDVQSIFSGIDGPCDAPSIGRQTTQAKAA